MIKPIIIFLLPIIIISTLIAQKQIRHEQVIWNSLTETISVTKRSSLNFQTQNRYFINQNGKQQNLFIAKYKTKINSNIQFGEGLLLFDFRRINSAKNKYYNQFELRPFQYIVLKNKFGKNSLLSQLKIEQRFQQKVMNETTTSNYNFTLRLRYLWSIQRIIAHSKTITFSVKGSIEPFINFGKSIIYNTFDQNRTAITLIANLPKNWTMNFAFMHWYVHPNIANLYLERNSYCISISHQINVLKAK